MKKFGGLNAMKAILSVDEIPELDAAIDAAVKLLKELPTIKFHAALSFFCSRN